MPLLPAPTQLSHREKDALIGALTARLALADAQIAAQATQIAALEARLDELTRPPKKVPCEPITFIRRWKERSTIATIRAGSTSRRSLLPLELQNVKTDPEAALLKALNNIGVVEFRTEKRINVPDIQGRARIKRRGGVRPPSARRS